MLALCADRCDKPLAHEEAPQEDSQGFEEGGVYWSLASGPRWVHHSPCWSEGLSPPHWAQQEGKWRVKKSIFTTRTSSSHCSEGKVYTDVSFMCPQIYRIGKGVHIQDGKVIRNNASTNYDTSQKTITPMVHNILTRT